MDHRGMVSRNSITLKVLHVSKETMETFINDMETEFGTETPLRVSCRHVHDYLEMTLDFSESGEVLVQMSDYMKTCSMILWMTWMARLPLL